MKNKFSILLLITFLIGCAPAYKIPEGYDENNLATITGTLKGGGLLVNRINGKSLDAYFLQYAKVTDSAERIYKIEPGMHTFSVQYHWGGPMGNTRSAFAEITAEIKPGKSYIADFVIRGDRIRMWIAELGSNNDVTIGVTYR